MIEKLYLVKWNGYAELIVLCLEGDARNVSLIYE